MHCAWCVVYNTHCCIRKASDVPGTSCRHFDLVCGPARICQLDGLGRHLAARTGWTRQVYQDWCKRVDHGLCGNAIVPLFYGYVADATDLRQAYWVLLPCYVYLVFYAFYGHKLRSWAR